MFNDNSLGLAPGIAHTGSLVAAGYHPSSVLCRPVDGAGFRLAYLLRIAFEFVLDDPREFCSGLFQWVLPHVEGKKTVESTVVSTVAPRLFVSHKIRNAASLMEG